MPSGEYGIPLSGSGQPPGEGGTLQGILHRGWSWFPGTGLVGDRRRSQLLRPSERLSSGAFPPSRFFCRREAKKKARRIPDLMLPFRVGLLRLSLFRAPDSCPLPGASRRRSPHPVCPGIAGTAQALHRPGAMRFPGYPLPGTAAGFRQRLGAVFLGRYLSLGKHCPVQLTRRIRRDLSVWRFERSETFSPSYRRSSWLPRRT